MSYASRQAPLSLCTCNWRLKEGYSQGIPNDAPAFPGSDPNFLDDAAHDDPAFCLFQLGKYPLEPTMRQGHPAVQHHLGLRMAVRYGQAPRSW